MIWGISTVWCPRDLLVTYSQHYCTKCRKYFSADLSDLAPPGSHYTHRVIDLAVRIVVEDGLPYRPASWHLWRDHRVFVPFATIQNWVEAGGKKAQSRMDTEFLADRSVLKAAGALSCALLAPACQPLALVRMSRWLNTPSLALSIDAC